MDEIAKKQRTTPEHQTGAEYAELHQYSAHKHNIICNHSTFTHCRHKRQLNNTHSYIMTANITVIRRPVLLRQAIHQPSAAAVKVDMDLKVKKHNK